MCLIGEVLRSIRYICCRTVCHNWFFMRKIRYFSSLRNLHNYTINLNHGRLSCNSTVSSHTYAFNRAHHGETGESTELSFCSRIGCKLENRCLREIFSLFFWQVGWVKADTKAIQAIGMHVITHNARVKVSQEDRHKYHLHIINATMEESGPYMCQLNTDPMKSQASIVLKKWPVLPEQHFADFFMSTARELWQSVAHISNWMGQDFEPKKGEAVV